MSHRMRFGHSAEEEPVEFVCFRALGIIPVKEVRLNHGDSETGDAIKGERRAYFGKDYGFADCPIYERSKMSRDTVARGPAIIEDPVTTIVVYPWPAGQDRRRRKHHSVRNGIVINRWGGRSFENRSDYPGNHGKHPGVHRPGNGHCADADRLFHHHPGGTGLLHGRFTTSTPACWDRRNIVRATRGRCPTVRNTSSTNPAWN